jgi:hypothetical protein
VVGLMLNNCQEDQEKVKMTEYSDKVEEQRIRLDKEQLDGQITMVDIRKGRIQTRFASGRVVTEYPRDKRKKTKIEFRNFSK